MQEKSGQGVNCIEWGQNGEDIFCGFNLGRIVYFKVKFKGDTMNHIPLYPEQFGSSVVQLSYSESLLLVSTMDRTFLLDVSTNKLDQVSYIFESLCEIYGDLNLLGGKKRAQIWSVRWLFCGAWRVCVGS